jgi:hypothetical protein
MYDKAKNKKPVREFCEKRFWASVEKTDGCWNWIKATNSSGYGVFHVRTTAEEYEKTGRINTQMLAHRLSKSLVEAMQPDDYILHTCDNRRCVNPDHLLIGTQMDNYWDMRNKGRGRGRGGKVL